MHYAVIGREDGDDEDTCFLTNARNKDEAMAEFKDMMKGPHREEATIYINYVLESRSSIDILVSNTTITTRHGG